ncbi:hypothetical protein V6Z12_A08G062000 [Gossypium hirsutum]
MEADLTELTLNEDEEEALQIQVEPNIDREAGNFREIFRI